MNENWTREFYRDAQFETKLGWVYKGTSPEELTPQELQVWSDLCRKAHIIGEIESIGASNGTKSSYDILRDEINDSCRVCNLSGPDVIRYEVLMSHYIGIVLDFLEYKYKGTSE